MRVWDVFEILPNGHELLLARCYTAAQLKRALSRTVCGIARARWETVR